MSAAKVLFTENIYVKLMNEDVEVWRPVKAGHIRLNIYKICDQTIPENEVWEYKPGDTVNTKLHEFNSNSYLIAFSLALSE